MKRAMITVLSCGLVLGAGGTAAHAQAAAPHAQAAAAHTFANCTDMHRTYRGGVARVGAVDKRSSGQAKYAPHVSTALYRANTKSDRDHDGVACEQ